MYALQANPKVALTIDGESWPYKVLLLRGQMQVEIVEGVPAEYAAAAPRYFGEELGEAWVAQVGQLLSHMGRITVRPDWVSIIDFQTRFPSAFAKRMA
jgi:hypothetical protein